jgi:hypothetical protein
MSLVTCRSRVLLIIINILVLDDRYNSGTIKGNVEVSQEIAVATSKNNSVVSMSKTGDIVSPDMNIKGSFNTYEGKGEHKKKCHCVHIIGNLLKQININRQNAEMPAITSGDGTLLRFSANQTLLIPKSNKQYSCLSYKKSQ